MNKQNILVVEDEQKLAEVVIDYLKLAEYQPHWIADGNSVIDWVKQNEPALILLDIMLPGKDGLEICREVRKFSDVPIIMVTARVEEIDRLLGLELGADDYICKPFSPREVVARVKTVLRRAHATPENSDSGEKIHFGGFTIDDETHQVLYDETVLELTPIEFRVLKLFFNNPRRVFSRNQLMDAAYTDQRVVNERTLDSHIKNLRKKLNNVATEEIEIRSIYGLGYKLESKVE